LLALIGKDSLTCSISRHDYNPWTCVKDEKLISLTYVDLDDPNGDEWYFVM